MKLVSLAGATLNQIPLDWQGNTKNILDAIADAKGKGVSLLCLPELCVSGYGCEDAFHSPDVHRQALRCLAEIVPHTKGMIVSLGLPLTYQGGLYNTVCLVADGNILGFAAKRFLAGDGIHYEPRWFKAWPRRTRAQVEIAGKKYPIGDYLYDCGGVRIGFEICEEAWVAERPGGELALRAVDVILNPSASHFAFAKFETRKRFVVEGSRAFAVNYVYSNLVGNESGRAIYDGGVLIASSGKMVAVGPRFGYSAFQLTTAVVDIDASRMGRERTASYTPNISANSDDTVGVPFAFPELEPGAPTLAKSQAWETGPHLKEEEFARAVSLGLFDYLRKSHSQGYVVSLSGGVDSSATSALVALTVCFGVKELGVKLFLERAGLPHVKAASQKEIVRALLTCVYQSTKNSSDVTRNAARTLAGAIGAEFYELDIESLVQTYTGMVSQALGLTLTWKTHDTALQNIQARVRSPGVWLVANIKNALLLCTSNRSEAAAGYATMDGDTSGGLSPIGAIDKAYLRTWLVWLEKTGPEGAFAIPELSLVNVQAPTAELRPLETKQTDEADLMPYEVLDVIERYFIRDRLAPTEIYRQMIGQFPQYQKREMKNWIDKFFRLWSRHQWKRERYAPSFHVDDASLDPKTWCRFPILSGGYERELKDLDTYVQGKV